MGGLTPFAINTPRVICIVSVSSHGQNLSVVRACVTFVGCGLLTISSSLLSVCRDANVSPPSCGKSTASTQPPEEKISFTVTKKSKNKPVSSSYSSSQVDAGTKKKTPPLPIGPVPKPLTPPPSNVTHGSPRTYAQAASPSQSAIYVAPGGQVMKGSLKVTPLRHELLMRLSNQKVEQRPNADLSA